jgi:Uri superfamily endonuclease
MRPEENSASTNIPAQPGTYALILRNRASRTIHIGALGRLVTRPGFYIYVGSALGPGGLYSRVSRHIRREKKLHWHIDYLRPHADVEMVWFEQHSAAREHDWAAAFGSEPRSEVALPRFGASDCRCESHLFYSKLVPSISGFRVRLQTHSPDSGVRMWRDGDAVQ